MKIPTAPRFLICRLSAVGDCVHTLPLANLIKARWPNSFVAWVVEPGPAPLVQQHAAVDTTVVVPKGFLKSPALLMQIARNLRALKADIALDPQSLTKSATLAWLSGAKTRIGFMKPQGRELSPWLNSHLVAPQEPHVVRRYLEVLRPLGVHASERDIVFHLPTGNLSQLSARFEQQLAEREFAIINPGAGWDSKVWPCERYGEVAAHLSVASLVVWAGEKEKAWAEAIVAASKGRATLAPPTSLLQLAALLRRARLFLGSDTGPLHMAAALGTPCVAMYGPTRPEVCGPYGPGHCVLQTRVDSLGSQRKQAGVISAAMLEITVPQVLSACEALLGDAAHCASRSA